MTQPIAISRKAFANDPTLRWNALIQICGVQPGTGLTATQRLAHLAYWYMSEVCNGGHDQYFGNQAELNHDEVVAALRQLQATCQAEVLTDAWRLFRIGEVEAPADYEDFITWHMRDGGAYRALLSCDERFHACSPQIETLLERFLDEHESAFIQWIE